MLRDDGERFLPWMADPVINYEHLHRYRAVRDLAAGRRVLDLASGEGYGSAMLAGAGGAVVGLELDREAVAHAAAAYPLRGLSFVQGSITEMPFGRGRFDLAVCFEALEHVVEQDRLCEEAARVVAPGGCFIVSTPNRAVYTEQSGFQNPFHVKELDLAEFTALLERHFRHVRVLGQRIYPISDMFPLEGEPGPVREYVTAREAGETRYVFVEAGRKTPRYFIGVASAGDLSAGPPALTSSILLDASEQLFELQRRSEGAVVELTRHLGVRERQALDLERRVGELHEELGREVRRVGELQEELGREVNSGRELADRAAELERHLRARAAQADELDALIRQRSLEVQALARTGDALRAEISSMESTLAWRLHRKARAGLQRLRQVGKRRPG